MEAGYKACGGWAGGFLSLCNRDGKSYDNVQQNQAVLHYLSVSFYCHLARLERLRTRNISEGQERRPSGEP